MIDLSPPHLETVKSILAAHVPEHEVRAFGSRATWTARAYSDLDLAVIGEAPVDRATIAELKEAFEDSDLPIRVDVLDWCRVSEGFRKSVEGDMVTITRGTRTSQMTGQTVPAAGPRDIRIT